MKTLLSMVMLGIALGACSNSPQEPAVVQATPAEKATAREAAVVVPTLDAKTMDEVKRTLQSEGKACAQVVEIHAREAENKLDVTCLESAGGTQRLTYSVDLGAI